MAKLRFALFSKSCSSSCSSGSVVVSGYEDSTVAAEASGSEDSEAEFEADPSGSNDSAANSGSDWLPPAAPSTSPPGMNASITEPGRAMVPGKNMWNARLAGDDDIAEQEVKESGAEEGISSCGSRQRIQGLDELLSHLLAARILVLKNYIYDALIYNIYIHTHIYILGCPVFGVISPIFCSHLNSGAHSQKNELAKISAP